MSCILNKKYIETTSLKMFLDGIAVAGSKRDGKSHEVQVILSDWEGDGFHGRQQWLSGCVDDVREFGGKLGLGKQTVLFHCHVFAPEKPEAMRLGTCPWCFNDVLSDQPSRMIDFRWYHRNCAEKAEERKTERSEKAKKARAKERKGK